MVQAGSADRVTVLYSADVLPKDISTATERDFPVVLVPLRDAGSISDLRGRVLVVDCDLSDVDVVMRLRSFLGSACFTSILFVTPKSDRAQFVQASALGADDVVARPIAKGRYLHALHALFKASRAGAPVTEGIKAGNAALRLVFGLSGEGPHANAQRILQCGSAVVDAVSEIGLQRWIEAVHQHHSATYQHCLLVAGTAVAFGQHLRFRRRDIDRVLLGALMHDLGKVAIPTEVLEKPGALDEAELALMRTHPAVGREMLERAGGFGDELLDVVGHHHELLDGSGYPNGLTADGLPDLVRVMTIADIFAALVEHRPYRQKMISPAEAFEILLSMRGKLDMALVRAFLPVVEKLGKAA